MLTSTSTSITFGLCAAAFWGVGDLAARFATRAVGPYRTLYAQQVVGLALLSVYLVATHGWNAAHGQSWRPWAWAVLAAALFNGSTLLLYIAFERGVLAVVSPISACYAVISAGLSLLTGEKLSAFALAGIGLVVFGLPFAASAHEVDAPGISVDESLPHEPSSPRAGIGMAIFSAIGFGISFWLYGRLVTPHLGGALSVWLSYLLSTLWLIPVLIRRKEPPVKLGRSAGFLACSASMAVLGTTCALTGLSTTHVALVTTLSSLYSTITVLLAWLILREPMRRRQWLGVALILAGVLLVRR